MKLKNNMNFCGILLGSIFLFALVTASPSVEERRCKKNFYECSDDKQCCGGCCLQNSCASFEKSKCQEAKQVCAKEGKTCTDGQVCYPTVVQCFTLPCPPLHNCKTPTKA